MITHSNEQLRGKAQWSTIGTPFVFNPAAGRTDDLTGFKWGKC